MTRDSAEQATRNVPTDVEPYRRYDSIGQMTMPHDTEDVGRRTSAEISGNSRERCRLLLSRRQAAAGELNWHELPPPEATE